MIYQNEFQLNSHFLPALHHKTTSPLKSGCTRIDIIFYQNEESKKQYDKGLLMIHE